ncbi:hypothetical protein PFICI_06154 [Pestalotiopsis fici W106-1]|uniref:Uncharacterized protein n=1 Tax=Pestalotiopsis fici (strain W106-1 / CGMCC3.15140) TaxID=1229662 RepID=W3X6X4_PESFW|nr:uncharacterized protein PFICI_06154 [Pestalotiopsis fici W106-1]ETS81152.1 hypothetical protein PFICI_06154 [Pestalotiopsis fici W106-1]
MRIPASVEPTPIPAAMLVLSPPLSSAISTSEDSVPASLSVVRLPVFIDVVASPADASAGNKWLAGDVILGAGLTVDDALDCVCDAMLRVSLGSVKRPVLGAITTGGEVISVMDSHMDIFFSLAWTLGSKPNQLGLQ